MTTDQPTEEDFTEKFQTLKQKFEEKFDVELDATGIDEYLEEENHENREYKLDGALSSKFSDLDFQVAGRIYVNYDNGEWNANCLFTVTVNDEPLDDCKGFQSHYDFENQEWNNLEYRAF